MRDRMWSGLTPEDGERSPDHRAEARAPLSLGIPDDDRFEAMMRRLVDQIRASERRYADALTELQSKLGQVTDQAAGIDATSESKREMLDRVQEEMASLTQRVEQAEHGKPDPFVLLERRMSEMSGEPDVFAAKGLPNEEQTTHHFADLFAAPSEPQPFAGVTSAELDDRLSELSQRFEQALKNSDPAEHIESIGERLDGVAERLDQALSRPETDTLASIEKQIGELASTFAEAEANFQRLGAIETQLSTVMERMAEGPAHMEQAAVKAATDAVKLVSGAREAADERLDGMQARLAALGAESRASNDRLYNTLDEVKLILRGLAPSVAREAAHAKAPPVEETWDPVPAPAARPAPVKPASEVPPVSAAPTEPANEIDDEPDFDPEHTSSLWPETVQKAERADKAKDRLGAAIPDYVEQPANNGEPERKSGGSDADFIAAARRAARSAAAKAKAAGTGSMSRGPRALLPIVKVLKNAPKGFPAARDMLKHPRPLLFAAAVILLLASGLILYSLLRAGADPLAAPTTEQRTPSSTDRASENAPAAITGENFAPAKGPEDLPRLAAPAVTGEVVTPTPASLKQDDATPVTVVSKSRSTAEDASEDVDAAETLDETDAHQTASHEPTEPQPAEDRAPALAPMAQDVAAPEAPAVATPTNGHAQIGKMEVPFGDVASNAASSGADATSAREMPPAAIGPWSLRLAASNGDAAASLEVGMRYAQGSGVDRDYAAAARWYAKAAAKGVPAAQYRLAVLYERGQGVAADLERARIWYRRAAELGNVKAMHNLGVMHTGQEGVEPDYTTAVDWFGQAARRGLADSQYNLGILYENGLGVKKNMGEAYKWFALAANGGDGEAQKRRDLVRPQLSASMRSEMDAAVQVWRPEQIDKAANGTNPSYNGWRSAASGERPLISRVQDLLSAKGYDIGAPDGRLGERTRDAIRSFERDNGMPETGTPSEALALSLGGSTD